MNESVVHVCPFAYLVNHMVKLHQIFVAYYVLVTAGLAESNGSLPPGL